MAENTDQRAEHFAQLNVQLGVLMAIANALNSIIIVVSENMTFPISSVIRYEVVELTDDQDKLTGEVKPVVFFSDGNDAFLTTEQNELFSDVWNKKAEIDAQILSVSWAFYQLNFPTQGLLPAAQAS